MDADAPDRFSEAVFTGNSACSAASGGAVSAAASAAGGTGNLGSRRLSRGAAAGGGVCALGLISSGLCESILAAWERGACVISGLV